jgi:penicillin-insensitive murein endopeptidase
VRALLTALLLVSAAPLAQAAVDDSRPAKELFGAVEAPAPAAVSRVIGSYAKGCLAGAVSLPVDGRAWQAMRLSRNRTWGHPEVGDIAQPRGGPMRTGHASHQIGLDADLWLTPMPDRVLTVEERETMSAVSMLADGTRRVDPARFGLAQVAVIRRAALFPEVERIFVHPGIKQALCEASGHDRDWLRKVRPWWGHDAHFHIRIRCPEDQPKCRPQEPAPAGDGCGEELAWWLSDEPWKKPDKPLPVPPPLKLADLPAECREVLLER